MRKEDFLERVRKQAGLKSLAEAGRVTQAVLETLGEFLYRDECEDLAAELPGELKGALFRIHSPEQAPYRVRRLPLQQFYNRVGARADLGYPAAVRSTQAVGRVLRQAVSSGQIDDVIEALPVEYREIFG